MRIKINFNCHTPLKLPLSYNYLLQGFVYSLIKDTILKNQIHNDGVHLGNRTFKPFNFSEILGRYKLQDNSIYYNSPFSLIISSSWKVVLEEMLNNFLDGSTLEINKQLVTIETIELQNIQNFTELNKIITLSPVTIYSTLQKADGAKLTHYYHYKEKEFEKLIKENLIKKAKVFYDIDIADKEFSIKYIEPLRRRELAVVNYKGFIIKAYYGKFELRGDDIFKKTGYELGIGSKSAQGFGCIEFV
jgi:CRISPR-associated endoribonuclease Cas6